MRTFVSISAALAILAVSAFQESWAQAPSIKLDITVTAGQISDTAPVTSTKTVYAEDGTGIRLVATATGHLFSPASAVEFTISQGGQVLKSYGPPGTATRRKSPSRSVPHCRSNLRPPVDCVVTAGPMAIVGVNKPPVIVNAKATGRGGTREITVNFVAYNNSAVSTTPPTPPTNPTPCTQTVALRPSYVFDNTTRKLNSASFYFSATYIGPAAEDGNLNCALAVPPGVSVLLDPSAPLAHKLDITLPKPVVYVGQVVRRGWWWLTAYSPEVQLLITCKHRFGNSGGVMMREGDPTSQNGCI